VKHRAEMFDCLSAEDFAIMRRIFTRIESNIGQKS